MRYKIFILLYTALICSSVVIISCSDVIDNNIINKSDNQISTRASHRRPTDYYYWYNGKKIEISSLRNLYYISSSDSSKLVAIDLKNSAVSTITTKQAVQSQKGSQSRFWKIVEIRPVGNVTTNGILSSMIQKLKGNKDVQVAPVFGLDEQDYISTSEYFYIKLKSSQDYNLLQSVAKDFDAKVIKEVDYMPNWYILKSPINSNGLETSNKFYETGKFADVDPAFMFNFKTNNCTSEPDFNRQWGLEKVNACNAWKLTKGKPQITVAVLDQGVDQNHREFANNYSPLSYDIHNGHSPSVVRGRHGTHVGGIIGANHNGIQIAGLAPQSTILSISHGLYISPTISSELATGFGYATSHNVDVINNSWGDQGGAFYKEMHSAILEDAIRTAMTSGRNGKGMIVVFASGNYNKSVPDYPANFHPDILVVGSVDQRDKKSSFSSYGKALDVVAPGSNILSTVPNNGLDEMSGTSMAAPHVSAIASLVLSINPELTRKDVVDIIEQTAQKAGNYVYSTLPDRTNGTWNEQMGYGICDAFSAVSAAQGGIVYFYDQTVTSNRNVAGWIIKAKNFNVTSNSYLKFTYGNIVTIDAPFTITKGSVFEISKK